MASCVLRSVEQIVSQAPSSINYSNAASNRFRNFAAPRVSCGTGVSSILNFKQSALRPVASIRHGSSSIECSFREASSAGVKTFMAGESGRLSEILRPSLALPTRKRRSTNGPRASAEDVPSFKGFAPMTEKPKWFWRILACIPYLMPLSETWMYAETAYGLFAFLEDYEFCTYPFLIMIGSLPGWFLLAYFFGAYLGIVRNNRWPHFLRFHVVTGMLLEIILQVMGTVNDWVPQSVYWGKIGAHYWLAVSMAFLFIVLDCIRCALSGMYADVPFLSDASYMQIPYE
ncbi:hypothetical protein R1sor_002262 [Riccia sorocarpa]|uniref:Protein TIC 20 n=1 Tax=Riccia sorocarpa TaxID=122646 RepID=A0ABD3GYB4_9MARC